MPRNNCPVCGCFMARIADTLNDYDSLAVIVGATVVCNWCGYME